MIYNFTEGDSLIIRYYMATCYETEQSKEVVPILFHKKHHNNFFVSIF